LWPAVADDIRGSIPLDGTEGILSDHTQEMDRELRMKLPFMTMSSQ
jgi:hypothetical protein